MVSGTMITVHRKGVPIALKVSGSMFSTFFSTQLSTATSRIGGITVDV